MTPDDITTLWLGATRYYLGRMTYAVSDYCAMLRSQWHALPESTRTLILRDLDEAIQRDDKVRAESLGCRYLPLGMDCDRAQWVRLREWIG